MKILGKGSNSLSAFYIPLYPCGYMAQQKLNGTTRTGMYTRCVQGCYARASIPIYRWRQMRQGQFLGDLLTV